jgi:hypothetical protein
MGREHDTFCLLYWGGENMKPEKAEDRYLNLLRRLSETVGGALAGALTKWLLGSPSDVSVDVSRGQAMLSVADGNLKTFELDSHLKAYKEPNHVFADLLVKARDKSAPILFWLSETNPPGAQLIQSRDPHAFIVALGSNYSFNEVCLCLASALSKQGVTLNEGWFAKVLQRNGVDPGESVFSSIIGAP